MDPTESSTSVDHTFCQVLLGWESRYMSSKHNQSQSFLLCEVKTFQNCPCQRPPPKKSGAFPKHEIIWGMSRSPKTSQTTTFGVNSPVVPAFAICDRESQHKPGEWQQSARREPAISPCFSGWWLNHPSKTYARENWIISIVEMDNTWLPTRWRVWSLVLFPVISIPQISLQYKNCPEVSSTTPYPKI